MSNIKILDLKKTLFLLLFSWHDSALRCSLRCLCVRYNIFSSAAQDVGIAELSEKELTEKRDKFIASDAMAKGWAAEIAALEKESLILQNNC